MFLRRHYSTIHTTLCCAVVWHRSCFFHFVSVACRSHNLLVILVFGEGERQMLFSAAICAAAFAFLLSSGQVQASFVGYVK